LEIGVRAIVLREAPIVKRTATLIALLCWLNGCSFLVHTSIIGGGASNGKIENGKYYVGDHGRYTEVSHSAYRFSWWHELSAAVSILVFMYIALDQSLSRKRKDHVL
jgi:hypothetical protein